ncbi:MAG TPA: TonB-dependent receptor [Bacteroidales bacterium]|nr:TonB-dependent receptor [Bacteroidales bacterium]
MRFFFILLFLVSLRLNAQETVIKIVDSKSGTAVQFANVCIESLDGKYKKYLLSNEEGFVKNSIDKRSTIAVSSLGYVSKLDTVSPGDSKVIALQPTVYNVDEVVVTGQFKAIRADKSIYKVEIINNERIKTKAANNLAELLTAELNLRVAADASLGTSISIQGLSGEHVKILVDGVPVIGRQNGILDLNQLLLSNVDHVEIVEGPMSVIYGSNALAGAINIITRSPNHGRILGRANTYYESAGVYNADVGFTYRVKHHSFNFNGGRNFFAGFSDPDTSRADQWKPKVQYFGDFNYTLNTSNNRLKLGSSIFYEDLRNKEAASEFTDIRPGGTLISYRALDEYHYTTRWNGAAEYQHKFSDKLQWESVLSYSYYQKTKQTYNKNLVTLKETLTDSSGQDTTWFDNWVFRSTLSRGGNALYEIQGGVDMSVENATGKRIEGKKRIDDYALFTSIKLFPNKPFVAQTGLRAIYNSKYKAPLVYALNLKYDPASFLGFRASYGRGFRSPSMKELYLNFRDINHNVSGNVNLEAETSHNLNFSISSNILNRKNHHLGADISLFYNAINNKIDFLYDLKNPTWAMYTNIPGNYISAGVDLKLRYKLHPRFSFNAGTNYLRRSKVADLNSFYTSRDYVVDFTYKNLKYLFGIALFYKYTDDWYTSRTYLDRNTSEGSIEEGRMAGYNTLDVTLSRPFFKNSLEIFVGAKNIFDVKNVDVFGSSGPGHGNGNNGMVGWGRTWFVKLSYNLIKY